MPTSFEWAWPETGHGWEPTEPWHSKVGAAHVVDLEAEENQGCEMSISRLLDELIMLGEDQEM